MKILLDMNISPAWQAVFTQAGYTAMHWSSIGFPDAADQTILNWARDKGYIIFTHDLDFGAILAATQATAPSVIQLRTQDISPTAASGLLFGVIERFKSNLRDGALISVDCDSARVRVLPIK